MPTGPIHLVTGANAGIGLAIARGLASAEPRPHVVLACRDRAKGEAAQRALREDLAEAAPGASLELLVVDLSSQRSIRAAAAAFAEKHPTLDVLVNNAAVAPEVRQDSIDGIELTWATNVLGYSLLTSLLQPLLERAASARVVNVASMMAGHLDLTDVEWKRRPYDPKAAYAQSKQANRMLTWELARRLTRSGARVTANALHPGAVDTKLLHALIPGMRGRTTAKGAETAVWLATSPDVAGKTGRFWSDLRETPCAFHDEQAEDALFALSQRMTASGDAG